MDYSIGVKNYLCGFFTVNVVDMLWPRGRVLTVNSLHGIIKMLGYEGVLAIGQEVNFLD